MITITVKLSIDPYVSIMDYISTKKNYNYRFDFEIGYLDRVAGGVVRVPFRDVRFDEGQLTLDAIEEDGSSVTVPLHRVREVWRNGEVIWRRGRAAPDPAPRA